MNVRLSNSKRIIPVSRILGQDPLIIEGALPVKEFDEFFLDMGYSVSLPEPLKYKAKLTDRKYYIELEVEFFGNLAFRCCECEKIVIKPYNETHVLWLVDEDHVDEFYNRPEDATDLNSMEDNEDEFETYEDGEIDIVDVLISNVIWMHLGQDEMDEALCEACSLS